MTNVDELIRKIIEIQKDSALTAKNLVQARGHKDFVARAYRQKSLF